MTAKLLPLMPPHRTYVEPFGGGASLLFAKEPSPVEVYNDLDTGLVHFFRVLADPALVPHLFWRCCHTPYSRTIFDDFRATWKTTDDPVERAYRWFVVARWSFSGSFAASFSTVVTASRRGMAETASKWLSVLDSFGALHERIMRVQIECQDWRVILDRYDTPETLFYLDPPYVADTRKSGSYAHELTAEDHAELVQQLLALKGMAMLSGYQSPVYEPLVQAGWEFKSWQTACHAAGRTRGSGLQGNGSAMAKQPRTECLWRNPRCVAACNDEAGAMLFTAEDDCQDEDTEGDENE